MSENMKTIEAWKKELKTPVHIFAGMKEKNKLAVGKQLTQGEYETAVNRFLKSSPCRKRKKIKKTDGNPQVIIQNISDTNKDNSGNQANQNGNDEPDKNKKKK